MQTPYNAVNPETGPSRPGSLFPGVRRVTLAEPYSQHVTDQVLQFVANAWPNLTRVDFISRCVQLLTIDSKTPI